MSFSLGFLSDFAKAAMGPIPAQVDALLKGASASTGSGGATGTTYSTAESEAEANSYSQSWGNRDVSSTMLQNIGETTHQAAHSERSRRASVVKEVSQSEHEELSTRVITNYNHMHALTIQYYEVLQIYRAEVKLTQVNRCIYIPFKLIDFRQPDVLDRYRPILARDPTLLASLASATTGSVVEVAPQTPPRATATVPGFVKPSPAPVEEPGVIAARPEVATSGLQAMRRQVFAQVVRSPRTQWNTAEISRVANLLERPVTRTGSDSVFLPGDAKLTGIGVQSSAQSVSFRIMLKSGEVLTSLTAPVPFAEVADISLIYGDASMPAESDVQMLVERDGVQMPLTMTRTAKEAGVGVSRVATMLAHPTRMSDETQAILQTKRLAYTQQVIRTLGSHGITSLLSPYYMVALRADGDRRVPFKVPLIQLVDPKPLGFVGNYLVFKLSSAEELETHADWVESLRVRGIEQGSARQDLVPLSSGGVFGEAVLGRFNAAEKLDVTRFWNWQDSPIPIQPPEIAALQSGSRATSEDTKPSGFAPPIVSIVQPQPMPDPAGTAAVLAAVQNGSMFRDMSGLAATIQAGTSALLASAQEATAAGQQAGGNMTAYLQSEVEKMRIAAQLISSLAGTAASALTGGLAKGGGGIGPGTPISNVGAAANYYDKAAGRTLGAGQTGAPSGARPSQSGQSSAGSGGGGSGGNNGGNGFMQASALPSDHPIEAATWGAFGKPQADGISSIVKEISGQGDGSKLQSSSVEDGSDLTADGGLQLISDEPVLAAKAVFLGLKSSASDLLAQADKAATANSAREYARRQLASVNANSLPPSWIELLKTSFIARDASGNLTRGSDAFTEAFDELGSNATGTSTVNSNA